MYLLFSLSLNVSQHESPKRNITGSLGHTRMFAICLAIPSLLSYTGGFVCSVASHERSIYVSIDLSITDHSHPLHFSSSFGSYMALHVVHKTTPISINYKCLPMVRVLSSVQLSMTVTSNKYHVIMLGSPGLPRAKARPEKNTLSRLSAGKLTHQGKKG